MGFSKYNKGRPFLVITRHASPAEGEKTETADWGKNGKWDLQEMVTIVDSIKDKHMMSAAIIIDLLQQKIVKTRFGESDDERKAAMTHYMQQYQKEIVEGIDIWMKTNTQTIADAEKLISSVEDEINTINKIEDNLNNIDIGIDNG